MPYFSVLIPNIQYTVYGNKSRTTLGVTSRHAKLERLDTQYCPTKPVEKSVILCIGTSFSTFNVIIAITNKYFMDMGACTWVYRQVHIVV